MCGGLSLRPARSEGAIAARISSMLLLQEALGALPPLAEALGGARCELLQARLAGGSTVAWVPVPLPALLWMSWRTAPGPNCLLPWSPLHPCRRCAAPASTPPLLSCAACWSGCWRRTHSPQKTHSSIGGRAKAQLLLPCHRLLASGAAPSEAPIDQRCPALPRTPL